MPAYVDMLFGSRHEGFVGPEASLYFPSNKQCSLLVGANGNVNDAFLGILAGSLVCSAIHRLWPLGLWQSVVDKKHTLA